MDDSFFLSLMGTATLFIYFASFFLSVRFRGEFGIMTDDTIASSQQAEHFSTTNNVLSNADCLSIPMQDIRYLLALYPGFRKKRKDNALASRLFNLKLDLKDA